MIPWKNKNFFCLSIDLLGLFIEEEFLLFRYMNKILKDIQRSDLEATIRTLEMLKENLLKELATSE